MTFVVPTSPCPMLTDPPFACGVFFLCTALGRRVLRGLHVPLAGISAVEHGLLATTLGVGLLQFVPFSLGMTHLLTPTALWISLICLALLLLPDIAAVGRRLAQVVRHPSWPGDRLDNVVLGVLGLLLALRLLYAFCPPTADDSLGYHLAAPKRWLQMGGLDYLPGMIIHTNSPMGLEMIYMLGMGIWSDTVTHLFHFGIGLLLLTAIIVLGMRLGNFRVGLFSAAIYLLLPKFNPIAMFTSAYIDLSPPLAILCAVLAWLQWKQTESNGWLVCAALYAGFAASFKLTAGPFILVLTALTVIRQYQLGNGIGNGSESKSSSGNQAEIGNEIGNERRAAAAKQGAKCLFFGLLPVLPWLGHAWLVTGNPIYPFLPRLFHTPDWSPEAGTRFSQFMRYYIWFSERTSLSLHTRHVIFAAVLVGTALLLAVLWQLWRSEEQRLLLACLGPILLIQMAATGPYIRYFFTPLPLLLLAGLLQIKGLLMTSHKLSLSFLALFLIGGFLQIRPELTSQAGLRYRFSTAVGRTSRMDYLNTSYELMPLWNYINTHNSNDTRVLSGVNPGCYYSDPYAYSSEPIHQWHTRCDTWEHFLADVKHDHITYLIASQESEQETKSAGSKIPIEQVAMGPELWDNEHRFVRRLATQYGQPVAYAKDNVLYVLRPF